MFKITMQVLEDARPGTRLCQGVFNDSGDTNICDTGKDLKWVATRGGIADWAIYYEPCYNELLFPRQWDIDLITRMGDKLPKSMTKFLVDVDGDALKQYRL